MEVPDMNPAMVQRLAPSPFSFIMTYQPKSDFLRVMIERGFLADCTDMQGLDEALIVGCRCRPISASTPPRQSRCMSAA
jgi:hypothetical protein